MLWGYISNEKARGLWASPMWFPRWAKVGYSCTLVEGLSEPFYSMC